MSHDPQADPRAGLTEERLNLEPIKLRLAAIIDTPPIRWGRHDAVALIEGDIPALLAEVARLRVALQAPQHGTATADEVKHGSHQAIVGGTDRTNDDPVSLSVRSHQHERLQQRADNEADGCGGVSDDGVVVEQGEGGRPRKVSNMRAESPSEQGNCLAVALQAPQPQEERGLTITTSTGITLTVERYNDLLEGERGLWQTLKAHGKLVAALMKIRDNSDGDARAIARDALATDLRDIDWSAYEAASAVGDPPEQTRPPFAALKGALRSEESDAEFDAAVSALREPPEGTQEGGQ